VFLFLEKIIAIRFAMIIMAVIMAGINSTAKYCKKFQVATKNYSLRIMHYNILDAYYL